MPGHPAVVRSPKELDRPRREAVTAIKPQDLVGLLAACPDHKALNACCLCNVKEPFEQRPTNLPTAELWLHIEILDLNIRLLCRDNLDACCALDSTVDIADKVAILVCHEEVGREAL